MVDLEFMSRFSLVLGHFTLSTVSDIAVYPSAYGITVRDENVLIYSVLPPSEASSYLGILLSARKTRTQEAAVLI